MTALHPLVSAALQAAEEHGHAAGPLGIPMWIWQLVNLVGFFALLLYFVARPVTEMFRKKQLEVEARAKEAQAQRAAAARLETEIHERMARLDRELEEIRARGSAEGESARAELLARADQDAERVRRDVTEEIERRLADAKEQLRQTAADLTAASAREIVSQQITPEDRARLLEESVSRVTSERPQ